MKKLCCFAGHRKVYDTENLYEKLLKAIEKLIVEENVTEFWVGGYGAFDKLSAKAVRKLKEDYSHIQLNLVIPYLTAHINEYKEIYYENYDHILIADIPENIPKKLWILKCNEYMINRSDFLICYVEYGFGGAAGTLKYAERKNIGIFNLCEM